MTDNTVVVLLSDKRSGSTMFLREIRKHPEVHTVAYSPHNLETHHWTEAAVILKMPNGTFAGGETYPGYGTRKNARIYMLDCIKRNVPEFQTPADDRILVFDGWEALCDKYAQPVFFEKTPALLGQWAALSLLIEWIQRTEYRVRIIGLVRNPLSVLYSAYQLFHTDPEKRQFGWLQAQKNMLAFQELIEVDFLQVKYEEIVADPQRRFAEICEFIGVLPSAAIGNTVHAGSLYKWRDDPYFNLQLDTTVKQFGIALGYSDEDLENPVKQEPPLSYRIRRTWARTYTLTLARFQQRIAKAFLLRLRSMRQRRRTTHAKGGWRNGLTEKG